MSNIDKQTLRDIAVSAESAPLWHAVGVFGEIVEPANPEWKPVHDFCKTFTADVVRALLDELEAAEKRIAELEAVKFKFSDSKLLSLAKDIVENLVDTGGSDPEYTQQYVDWTFKRIRAAAGKGE